MPFLRPAFDGSDSLLTLALVARCGWAFIGLTGGASEPGTWNWHRGSVARTMARLSGATPAPRPRIFGVRLAPGRHRRLAGPCSNLAAPVAEALIRRSGQEHLDDVGYRVEAAIGATDALNPRCLMRGDICGRSSIATTASHGAFVVLVAAAVPPIRIWPARRKAGWRPPRTSQAGPGWWCRH
jgi:hypothetical protein